MIRAKRAVSRLRLRNSRLAKILLSFFTDSARRLAIPDSELSQLSLFRKYKSGARMYSECDLNSQSNVLIIGGYLGSSSEIIASQFDSKLTIFEPIQEFAKVLEHKFSSSKKIRIIPKAVARHDGTIELFKNLDSPGLYAQGESNTVECVSLSKYLLESDTTVDLLEMNIEGAEFDVLPGVIETGAVAFINNLLIQFHNNDDFHEIQRAQIRSSLRETHKEVFCYEWVWELWKKI